MSPKHGDRKQQTDSEGSVSRLSGESGSQPRYPFAHDDLHANPSVGFRNDSPENRQPRARSQVSASSDLDRGPTQLIREEELRFGKFQDWGDGMQPQRGENLLYRRRVADGRDAPQLGDSVTWLVVFASLLPLA